MTDLRFPTDSFPYRPLGADSEPVPTAPEQWLTDSGISTPHVRVNIITDSDNEFVLVMGIDPKEPINRTAQRAITLLASLHIMVFGPAMILGLNDTDATYLLEVLNS